VPARWRYEACFYVRRKLTSADHSPGISAALADENFRVEATRIGLTWIKIQDEYACLVWDSAPTRADDRVILSLLRIAPYRFPRR
jgi:hypothetical protein